MHNEHGLPELAKGTWVSGKGVSIRCTEQMKHPLHRADERVLWGVRQHKTQRCLQHHPPLQGDRRGEKQEVGGREMPGCRWIELLLNN